MSGRDGMAVLVPSAAALVFAWPVLRESNCGPPLAGHCEGRRRGLGVIRRAATLAPSARLP